MECEFCSSFFLLPVFFGVTFVLLCTRYYLVPLLFAAVLSLTVVSWIPLHVPETVFYLLVGLASGALLKYGGRTTRILPKNLLKHNHNLLVYVFELLTVPVLFYLVDDVAEVTGYPSGLLVSFAGYVGWFIVTYNVNFRHEGMLKQSEVDVALYNQTYLYWFASLVPFYLAALVPMGPPAQCVIGFLALGVLLLLERAVSTAAEPRSKTAHTQ